MTRTRCDNGLEIFWKSSSDIPYESHEITLQGHPIKVFSTSNVLENYSSSLSKLRCVDRAFHVRTEEVFSAKNKNDFESSQYFVGRETRETV